MPLSGRKAAPGREREKEVEAAEAKEASLEEIPGREVKEEERETEENARAAVRMENLFATGTTTSRQGAGIRAVISSMSVDFVLGNTHYTPASLGIVLRLRETAICLRSD